MLINYLIVALRNLKRHPLFSFINIFGLALSLSFCLLVVVITKDQFSFESFHKEPENVYRILTNAHRKSGAIESYASTPQPLGAVLRDGSTQVSSSATLVRFSGEVRTPGEAVGARGFFADDGFFDIFTCAFKEGLRQGSLTNPNSIVITSELSMKLFGDQPAVGKTIDLGGYGMYQVTAVLQPFPGKTHLELDALISSAAMPTLAQQGGLTNVLNDWNNYYFSYTYLRLKHGSRPEDLRPILESIPRTYYAGLTLESRDAGYSFELQPLLGITPGPMLSNSMGRGVPVMLIYFMSVLALIGMGAAIFNYTMLTLARALSRAKEVGIRKVSGAARSHLFLQFVLESVIVMVFALLLGEVLLRTVMIPGFSSLQMTRSIDVTLDHTTSVYPFFIGIAMLFGTIAGIVPAWFLSRLRPAVVMKDIGQSRLFSRMTIRKVLIVVQFVLSLTFVIVLTIMSDQIEYATTYDFAFSRDHIISVNLQGNEVTRVVPVMTSYSDVKAYTTVSHLPGTWQDRAMDVRTSPSKEWSGVRDYSVDGRFVDVMGLDLIAGRNFNDEAPGVSKKEIIVNERFLERFELGSPDEAVGKTIHLEGDQEVQVAGVLRDFLFKPLTYALEPMMLIYDPEQWNVLLLQTAGNDPSGTMAHVRKTWREIDKTHEGRIDWFDDILSDVYSDFDDIILIVAFLSFLAFVISMLGLLGIVTLNAESRIKEVGIRKVLGADVRQIVVLLARREAILLGVSTLIAVPLGLFAGSELNTEFAHRISLGPAVVLPGLLLILVVAAAIVGVQALRASRSNPIQALHYE